MSESYIMSYFLGELLKESWQLWAQTRVYFGQMQKLRLSDRAIPAKSVPAVTFPVHCASQPGVRCPGPETPHLTQLRLRSKFNLTQQWDVCLPHKTWTFPNKNENLRPFVQCSTHSNQYII